MFSLQNVKKPLVLLCFRSQSLKNPLKTIVILTLFLTKFEKPFENQCNLLFFAKKMKKKKTITFYMKNCKKSNFALFSLCFLLFWTSPTGLGTGRGLV